MKKTLIAAAVMAASGVAFAASNVTLYGVIEEGVVLEKAKHGDTLVKLQSGFDQGSRWGIKGVEDLGNGYAVGFILEQGFNADSGNESVAGKAFSRESFLYLTGDFGRFGFPAGCVGPLRGAFSQTGNGSSICAGLLQTGRCRGMLRAGRGPSARSGADGSAPGPQPPDRGGNGGEALGLAVCA